MAILIPRVLKVGILSMVSIFAPIKPVLVTALVMVFADLLTGVIASRKRGEKITSAGFQRSIVKIFVYELAIILAFLTEKNLTGDLIPVLKMVTAFVGLTELTSVMENLNEISGGSLLSALVAKLGSKTINE